MMLRKFHDNLLLPNYEPIGEDDSADIIIHVKTNGAPQVNKVYNAALF